MIMKNKKLIIIFCIILVLGLTAAWFINQHMHRVIMNTGYVNGNTPGNLYNAGLFCESNGEVFFSNPDDEGRLYVMNPDGTNIHKLCDDTVMYINADDHYVYYVRNNDRTDSEYAFFSYNNNSLCRMPRKGGKIYILDRDPCIYASLIGNYIYYLHYDNSEATSLYRVRIDGKERKQIRKHYVFTCSSLGQYFYYNGNENDGNLYCYDTATGIESMVYECDCYKPIVSSDSNVYYMDVTRNMALVHTNTAFDNPVILTKESVDLFNVYGSYIYYQVYDSKNPRLCMIKNDGTDQQIIAFGNYKQINVTSHYTYFTEFSTGETFYTPTANPGTLYPFHPGAEK